MKVLGAHRLATMLTISATAVLAVVGTATAYANSTGSKPPASGTSTAPSPQLQPLAWFVGSWTCDGTVQSPDGTPVPMRAEAAASFDFGGQWLVWNVTQHVGSAAADKGIAFWGWNASRNSFSLTSFNSQGNRADELSSGWLGNVLFSEGEAHGSAGPAFPSRTTTEKVNENTMRETGSINVSGEWRQIFQTTCTR